MKNERELRTDDDVFSVTLDPIEADSLRGIAASSGMSPALFLQSVASRKLGEIAEQAVKKTIRTVH